MTRNIGSALLILGATYFYLVYNLEPLIAIVIALLGVITLTNPVFGNEQKDLINSEIALNIAKAGYYKKR